jgi:predicted O-methyltransferase YrrM
MEGQPLLLLLKLFGGTMVRKQLKKIIPRSFFTLESKIELYRIRAHGCDASPLADVSRINLGPLFASMRSQDELIEIEKEVRDLGIPDESGGVNPGDRRAIYCLIRNLMPKSVLEIGTHIGASMLYIALALKKLRAITPGTSYNLISVDIRDVNDTVSARWRKYGSKLSPIEMLKQTGSDDLVSFVAMDSLEFFQKCTQRYDLIFLDGSHSSATVYKEIPVALRVLRFGGYILLHDYFPNLRPLWPNGAVVPGPYLATQRLAKEGAPIEVLPLGELPWRTKLHSNITSLALMGRK